VFITKYNVANQSYHSIICTRTSFCFQKVFDADSNTGMALAWAGEHGVSNSDSNTGMAGAGEDGVSNSDSNTGMALAWAGEHSVSNSVSKSWTA
jgi:hypothetical protein